MNKMSSLENYKLDENKVWFGDYCPSGVRKKFFKLKELLSNHDLNFF